MGIFLNTADKYNPTSQSIDTSKGTSTRDDGGGEPKFVTRSHSRSRSSGHSYHPDSNVTKTTETPKTIKSSVTRQTEQKREQLRQEAFDAIKEKQAKQKAASEFAKKSSIEQYRLLKEAGYKESYRTFMDQGVILGFNVSKEKKTTRHRPVYTGMSKRDDMRGLPKFVQRSYEWKFSDVGFNDVKPKQNNSLGTIPKQNKITFFSFRDQEQIKPNTIEPYNPKLTEKIQYEVGKLSVNDNQLIRSGISIVDFGIGFSKAGVNLVTGAVSFVVNPFETAKQQTDFAIDLFTNQQSRDKLGQTIRDRPAQAVGYTTGLILIPKFTNKLIDKGVTKYKTYKFEQKINNLNYDKSYKFDKNTGFTDINNEGLIIQGKQTQLRPNNYDPLTKFEIKKLSEKNIINSGHQTDFVVGNSKIKWYSTQKSPELKSQWIYDISKPKQSNLKNYGAFNLKYHSGEIPQFEGYDIPRSRKFLDNKKAQFIQPPQQIYREKSVFYDDKSTLRANLDAFKTSGSILFSNTDSFLMGSLPKTNLLSGFVIQSDKTKQNIPTNTITEIKIKNKIPQQSFNQLYQPKLKPIEDRVYSTTLNILNGPQLREPRQRTKQRIKQISLIALDVPVLTKQIPILKSNFVKEPVFEPPTTTTRYKTSIELPPPINPMSFKFERPKNNFNIGFSQGFDLFVRVKGKFKKQNINPLSKGSALSLGLRKTEYSAAASFKLKKSNSKVKSFSKYSLDSFKLKKQYYTKKEDDDLIYIEKPKYRISTLGEKKDITFKGV